MGQGKRKPEARAAARKANSARETRARALRFGGLLLILGSGLLLLFLIRPFSTPSFDGGRAFQHLVAQYRFGPRVPGTEAHRGCREYILRELEKSLPEVRRHSFRYQSALLGWVEGTNIWASVPAASKDFKERVMLCAHWDSRPVADRETEPSRRSLGVPGANDGASGVAVLLEVARILGKTPPPVRVEIVFFDMEDLGGLPLLGALQDPFCVGSSRFVKEHPEFRVDFGILLDMVGKKNLRIPKEAISLERAPHVVDRVWKVARRLNAKAFVEDTGPAVMDDHVPFLERGIPVINLIDMEYPAWHTLQDTPDRCSEESLRQVGEVVLGVIYGS